MVLKVVLEKELEQKFRELAMKKFGFSKGALKSASKEALEEWLYQHKKIDLARVKDPVKRIEGLLKHLRGKYTSVELQHQTKELWAKQN